MRNLIPQPLFVALLHQQKQYHLQMQKALFDTYSLSISKDQSASSVYQKISVSDVVNFSDSPLPDTLKYHGAVHFTRNNVEDFLHNLRPHYILYLLQRYYTKKKGKSLQDLGIWVKHVFHLDFSYVSVKYEVHLENHVVCYKKELFQDLKSACEYISHISKETVTPSELGILSEFRTQTMRFHDCPLKMTKLLNADDDDSTEEQTCPVLFSVPLSEEGREYLRTIGPVHIMDSPVIQKLSSANILNTRHDTMFNQKCLALRDEALKAYPENKDDALIFYSADVIEDLPEYKKIFALHLKDIGAMMQAYIDIQEADYQQQQEEAKKETQKRKEEQAQ